MSYCRFSEADIYLYNDCGGYINCQCCHLAPKVKTIFTVGGKFLGKKIKPCNKCHGEGCDECMMRGDTHLNTSTEALEHVKLHRVNGDYIPEDVDKRLLQEIAGKEV